MQRVTITLDEDLAAELDAFQDEIGAGNRSEAVRELIRRGLATRPQAPAEAACMGVVSCVIDQSVRTLGSRVPQSRLDRHNHVLTTLSVPLDHTTSLDVSVMSGTVGDIGRFAEALFLERGVLHGSLALIPVCDDKARHTHEGEHLPHSHVKVQASF